VRTEVRHRLKQDPFAEQMKELAAWFTEHQVNIIGGIIIAAIIIGGGFGWWYHTAQRSETANAELGAALQTLNAPIMASPVPGVDESYATVKARSEAAEKKFDSIAGNYSHTKAAAMARYFSGVARMEAGDNAGAEQQLKQVADSGDASVAALARMALASIYASTGRDAQAVAIYQNFIEHPTDTVPKDEAQLQLAGLYAQTQPDQAKKIYQQMAKGDPTSPVTQMAQNKLAQLK
jgi:predicted negative regulator of RcsB-dependent stress response